MSRPREFDPESTLSTIMEIFWAKGYEATSFDDLTRATGVAKASLYSAYGDKHQLFLASLDRYITQMSQPFTEFLENTPSAKDALKGFFHQLLDECEGQHADRGCFCVNAAVEFAPHDEEVVAILQRHTTEHEQVFERLLTRGKLAGEFRSDLDAKKVSRFIVSSMIGLHVTGKVFPDSKRLGQIVEVILSAVE